MNFNIFEIVNEAKDNSKNLKSGDVWLCYFPTYPNDHKERPAIIVRNNGIGPFVMATGHIDDGKDNWKKYEENKLIKDWKYEGFDKKSYANTHTKNGLYYPNEIKLYRKIGTLTKTDYDNIVQPVIDELIDEKMNNLFECFGLEYMIDLLIEL